MRILLDACFLIDHLRGEPAAVRRFAEMFEGSDEPFVNEVVVAEVRSGMRVADEPRFRRLIEPIEFIQPGPDSALLAGAWRRAARERGQSLSVTDALIAAAADVVDAAVLTRDLRDFALTPVRVLTY
ncbi:MAG TPA: PIN domain-containing protein [Candidatus Sulfomarinibacteraceae bacterium]|nr:PIN domain-containing protein [Candidatus Sulfomarinibacteraceae bacterium]